MPRGPRCARAGRWFDPRIVAAFEPCAEDDAFWAVLENGEAERAVLALEPAARRVPLDKEYLDAIADAFGSVVDAKSPYTAGHSARVGHYSDALEWAAVRQHAEFTEQILGRISHFAELARIAAANHEKLDGTGYPRGVGEAEIALETRIITTADIFDAITAERPYRGATPVEQALATMRGHVGTAIDPTCFAALEAIALDEAVSSSC
ncbi:HD-GYP domain-containing protein [Cognatilysobacter bugurensis]|uniref:HD-GYP domain-containing protein n=1 Tax=Cognatilysobacter bugurensis TaxID=543356 RepID=A0A918SWR4_9GAMM|nr:HD domain-containing phosphohydrolase [Lysobacter bugurensis]GHA74369.1 hypothetical protein GCM10007067_09160 [Lysobacter bugurensis]